VSLYGKSGESCESRSKKDVDGQYVSNWDTISFMKELCFKLSELGGYCIAMEKVETRAAIRIRYFPAPQALHAYADRSTFLILKRESHGGFHR
jgi:hypothetical protein